jgi:hypothetical protein
MHCIETEIEPAHEAAKPMLNIESGSRRNARPPQNFHRGKSWNGVALLASAAGLGSIGGLAWLYFYAVSAIQSALSAFRP